MTESNSVTAPDGETKDSLYSSSVVSVAALSTVDASVSSVSAPASLPSDAPLSISSMAFGPIVDPQYVSGQEWQVNDAVGVRADLNVSGLWEEYQGRGVRIAVVDDGIDASHGQLSAAVDLSRSYDVVSGRYGSSALASGSDHHGTAVAGIIAQPIDGIGGVGVAPSATLVSIRLPFSTGVYGWQIEEALRHERSEDVANHSWGFSSLFYDNFRSSSFSTQGTLLHDAATYGRNGLGTVIVQASGNSKTSGDDTNAHGYQSSQYVITVGSTDSSGNASWFSTAGANVLVSAPGQAVATTDGVGSSGFVSGDYVTVDGTSFAAPAVSAVVALMLEANGGLGYRDVQTILAYSARNPTASDAPFAFNGASNWNGGGLHVSNSYGFGLVDAHAAVRLAETWEGRKDSWFSHDTATVSSSPHAYVGNGQTVSSSVSFGSSLGVEHARLSVSIGIDGGAGFLGDLSVDLISASGTVSHLLANVGNGSGTFTSGASFDWDLSSVQFLGEQAFGTWTVRLLDSGGRAGGYSLNSFSLTLDGTPTRASDVFVYTDEYGRYASTQSGRTTFSDTGADVLDMAAMTTGISGTLSSGGGLRFDSGAPDLVLASGTRIKGFIGGDGADSIRGNDLGDSLNGGRGNDTLIGGAGNDVLVGGRGSNVLTGGGGDDVASFSGPRSAYSWSQTGPTTWSVTKLDGTESDVVTDIRTLSFSDGSVTLYALAAPPVTGADSAVAIVGKTLVIPVSSLLANDLSSSGFPLSIVSVSGGQRGTVTLSADGSTISFVPEAGYSGQASFSYVASDGHGNSAQGSVSVNVVPPPLAAADSISGAVQGRAMVIDVSVLLANDVDPNGFPLRVSSVGDATHGTATLSADGTTVTFVPEAGYHGPASFSYEVSDPYGGTSSATVSVPIAVSTAAPTAADSSIVGYDGASTFGHLDAVDPSGGPAAIHLVGGSSVAGGESLRTAHGNVYMTSGGYYDYVADANWRGADSFSWTAVGANGASTTKTVTVADQGPGAYLSSVLNYSGVAIVGSGVSVETIDIGDGRWGNVGAWLNLSYDATGISARVDMRSDWTSNSNFFGLAGKASGSFVDASGVVHGDHVISVGVPGGGSGWFWSDKGYSDPSGGAASGWTADILVHDGFRFGVASGQLQTSAIGFGGGSAASTTRSPDGLSVGTAGNDTLVGGAGADVLVGGGGDDALFGGAGNDTAVLHGVSSDWTATREGAHSWRLVNASGETKRLTDIETASFEGGGSLSLDQTNHGPTAHEPAAHASTTQGRAVTLSTASLLSSLGASDPDGDPVSITSVSVTDGHGTVSLSADGASVIFTPDPAFWGTSSFSVTISDPWGGSVVASVPVDVAHSVPPPLVPDSASLSVRMNDAIVGRIGAVDPLGLDLSYALDGAGAPAHGTVTFSPDGTFSYVAAHGFVGADSFVVRIANSGGAEAYERFSVLVAPDAAPMQVFESGGHGLAGATSVLGKVTFVDGNADGDVLSLSVASGPAHGSVSLAADGSYEWQPTVGYSGRDSFSVLVDDGHGGSLSRIIDLAVGVNAGPSGSDSSVTDVGGMSIGGRLVAADSDGDALTFALSSGPRHGTVVLSSDGYYSYEASSHFSGVDSFVWTASDGFGGSTSHVVSINDLSSGASFNASAGPFSASGGYSRSTLDWADVNIEAIDIADGRWGNVGAWLGAEWEGTGAGATQTLSLQLHMRADAGSNAHFYGLSGSVSGVGMVDSSGVVHGEHVIVLGSGGANGSSWHWSDVGLADPTGGVQNGFSMQVTLHDGQRLTGGAGGWEWQALNLSGHHDASSLPAQSTIVGSVVDAVLFGTSADETLIGIGGNSHMTGGGGSDVFVLHAGSVATVTDFSVNSDVLRLSGLDPAEVSFVQASGDLHVTSHGADLAVLQHVSISDFGGAVTGADAMAWALDHQHMQNG